VARKQSQPVSANGVTANAEGNGVTAKQLTDEQIQKIHAATSFVQNQMLARSEFIQKFMDPRRDYNAECGYPDNVNQFKAEEYEDLYEREPIACRVVQLYPKECWQVIPEVFEDQSSEVETEFEKAWVELCASLSAGSKYEDEQGNAIWEYLYRTDLLAGIGSWGILLLGFDDGRMLQEPVDGAPTDGKPFDISGLSEIQQAEYTNEFVKSMYAGVDEQQARTKTGVRPGDKDEEKLVSPFTGAVAEVSKDIYGGAVPMQPMSSTMGTDALYRGIQFTPETPGAVGEGKGGAESQPAGKKKKPLRLLFLRPYAQYLVQIVQYEADIRNPRFGHPLMYLVTVNDPRQQHTGVGLPLATVRVHWSRIIHVADERQSSEIFGIPRMRPVLHRILDLRKLYGGGAEGYWKNCFAAMALETHPQLGGDVVVDQQATRDVMEQFMNGLQRYLLATGMSAKMLAPTVVDPASQIDKQIEAICIQLGCPKRVFMGSERGELASSQDDQAWNDRLRHRQNFFITPRIIAPFIDRLIALGVLPTPEKYGIKWPDLESLSRKDKAQIGLQQTQALAAYVSGSVEQIVPPVEYLTRIMELDQDEAEEILESAKSAVEDDETFTVPSEADEEQDRQDQKDQFKQQLAAGQVGGGKGGPAGGVAGGPPGQKGVPPGAGGASPKPPPAAAKPKVGKGGAEATE